MKKYLLRSPAIILTILIFLVSSFSLDKLPDTQILSYDKIIHIIEYAVYTFSVTLALSTSSKETIYRNLFLISVSIGLMYGAIDEFHQFFVNGRKSSIFDWFADAGGSFLGIYLYNKLKNIKWLSYDPID
ncbi:MAG: VanZ family protein [Candidatus Marinimicrobia bacterium]|nr:VanZ family protein [Candidatus Neomarinimicrobiota bacterium]